MKDLRGKYSPQYLNVIQQLKLMRLTLPPRFWWEFDWSCWVTESISYTSGWG